MKKAFKFIPIQPHHFRDEKKEAQEAVTCLLLLFLNHMKGKNQGIIDFRVCRD